MNSQTVLRLCELNSSFYRTHAASFSETRGAPWAGWRRCVGHVRDLLGADSSAPHIEEGGVPKTDQIERAGRADSSGSTGTADLTDSTGLMDSIDLMDSTGLTVLDLACGNLRFEAFLNAELPETRIIYYSVDNCPDLVSTRTASGAASPSCLDPGRFDPRGQPAQTVIHQNLDVLSLLYSGSNLHKSLNAPLCDLSVSFGFLHHVPTIEYRKEILLGLIESTRPGGLVMVSFWQFMNDEKLAKKARATHFRALSELDLPPLDDNDYILGWKDAPGAYRYCHSFSETEIDHLVALLADKATVLSRFKADGRTDDLNTYLVMQATGNASSGGGTSRTDGLNTRLVM